MAATTPFTIQLTYEPETVALTILINGGYDNAHLLTEEELICRSHHIIKKDEFKGLLIPNNKLISISKNKFAFPNNSKN